MALRSRVGAAVTTAMLALAWVAGPVGPAAGDSARSLERRYYYGEPVEYLLTFPVGGDDVYFADDDLIGFGACRDGCSRRHEGVDIMAPKMTPVYAAADAHRLPGWGPTAARCSCSTTTAGRPGTSTSTTTPRAPTTASAGASPRASSPAPG